MKSVRQFTSILLVGAMVASACSPVGRPSQSGAFDKGSGEFAQTGGGPYADGAKLTPPPASTVIPESANVVDYSLKTFTSDAEKFKIYAMAEITAKYNANPELFKAHWAASTLVPIPNIDIGEQQARQAELFNWSEYLNGVSNKIDENYAKLNDTQKLDTWNVVKSIAEVTAAASAGEIGVMWLLGAADAGFSANSLIEGAISQSDRNGMRSSYSGFSLRDENAKGLAISNSVGWAYADPVFGKWMETDMLGKKGGIHLADSADDAKAKVRAHADKLPASVGEVREMIKEGVEAHKRETKALADKMEATAAAQSKRIAAVEHAIVAHFEEQKKQQADAAHRAEWFEERAMTRDAIRNFASDVTMVLQNGGPNEQKAARYIGTVASASLNLASAIDQVNKAATAAKGIATISACFTGIGAAIAVIQLFSATGPSPEAAMMEAIGQLSKQIESLRVEMNRRFDMLDTRLDQITNLILDGFKGMNKKLDNIDYDLGRIVQKLNAIAADTKLGLALAHPRLEETTRKLGEAKDCIEGDDDLEAGNLVRKLGEEVFRGCVLKLRGAFSSLTAHTAVDSDALFANVKGDPEKQIASLREMSTRADELFFLTSLVEDLKQFDPGAAADRTLRVPAILSDSLVALNYYQRFLKAFPERSNVLRSPEFAAQFKRVRGDHQKLQTAVAESGLLGLYLAEYQKIQQRLLVEMRGDLRDAIADWSKKNVVPDLGRIMGDDYLRACGTCEPGIGAQALKATGNCGPGDGSRWISTYTRPNDESRWVEQYKIPNFQNRDPLFFATEKLNIAVARPSCFQIRTSGLEFNVDVLNLISPLFYDFNSAKETRINDYFPDADQYGMSEVHKKPEVYFSKTYNFRMDIPYPEKSSPHINYWRWHAGPDTTAALKSEKPKYDPAVSKKYKELVEAKVRAFRREIFEDLAARLKRSESVVTKLRDMTLLKLKIRRTAEYTFPELYRSDLMFRIAALWDSGMIGELKGDSPDSATGTGLAKIFMDGTGLVQVETDALRHQYEAQFEAKSADPAQTTKELNAKISQNVYNREYADWTIKLSFLIDNNLKIMTSPDSYGIDPKDATQEFFRNQHVLEGYRYFGFAKYWEKAADTYFDPTGMLDRNGMRAASIAMDAKELGVKDVTPPRTLELYELFETSVAKAP